MLKLPNVAIISINCKNPEDSVKAIQYSCKDIEFKSRHLFTSAKMLCEGVDVIKIPHIDSVFKYSDFILRLSDYKIDADFFLIVQDDGFVLNADKWDNSWLEYDYIGAAWPGEDSWIDIQKARDFMRNSNNRVGNGGFSLRSRKFLSLSSQFANCEGYGEDNYLCLVKKDFMLKNGIKFPPLSVANSFSMENNLQDWKSSMSLDTERTFGFHGHNFINSQELINLKN